MSIFDRFFGDSDRRTELGNALIESLEKRHGFQGAREILHGGATDKMTGAEVEQYNEWKQLQDGGAEETQEDYAELARRLAEHEKWQE